MTPVCDGGGGVPARIGGAPPSPFSSALLMLLLVVVVTGGGRGLLTLLEGCPPTLALLPVDADDEGFFGLRTVALLLFIFKICCVLDCFLNSVLFFSLVSLFFVVCASRTSNVRGLGTFKKCAGMGWWGWGEG